MPFTAAERMKQYRKRWKENEGVYEKTKEKDRQRQAIYKKISNDQKPA